MTATMTELGLVLAGATEQKVIPEVGIYRGISEHTYHKVWDAASNSRLSKLRRTPAHLRAYLDEPAEDTEALRIGRAVHAAILEPDSFTGRYVCAEQCGATKKGDGLRCANAGIMLSTTGWVCGVHAKGATEAIENGVTVVSPTEYAMCLRMRDAVHAHLKAHGLLSGQGENELSIVWDDRDTGLRCKARIDRHSPLIAGGVLCDLKSARDGGEEAFAKAIYEHGYHRQGALYLEGAEVVGLEAHHFVNIVPEKEAPFAVAVYRLREDAILRGATELRSLKRRYADCLARDEWPAYSPDVIDIALPEWAAKKIDHDTEVTV